jgi:hypothetical protein
MFVSVGAVLSVSALPLMSAELCVRGRARGVHAAE